MKKQEKEATEKYREIVKMLRDMAKEKGITDTEIGIEFFMPAHNVNKDLKGTHVMKTSRFIMYYEYITGKPYNVTI